MQTQQTTTNLHFRSLKTHKRITLVIQMLSGLEFEDVEEYEEEFDQLERSNQNPRKGQKTNSGQNQFIGPNNSMVKERQEKGESNFPSKQSINKIEAPSKENNWNQSKKVTSSVQHYQKQQQLKNSSLISRVQNQNPHQTNMQPQQQPEDSQPQIIQNQQPQQQSFTLLTNKPQAHPNDSHIKTKLKTEPQLSKQQLSHMIYENEKVIKQLKNKTALYRQQIKNISNLVDKDIHKSIVKISNSTKNTINIKNIFNEIYTNESPNILKLREELLNVRTQSKQLKAEISSIQDKLNDPISHQNTLKHQQLQTKLKLLSAQLNKTKEEKHFAVTELQRMKLSSGLVEFQHFEKSILKNQQTLTKLLTEIKQERAKIYKLQKQDIFYMEKLKFLTQNHQKLQSTLTMEKSLEQKPSSHQLKKSILALVNQINSILEQRNTIENDKSKLIKSLSADIESMENKNLQLLNQVRNIDASLLQFYTHKAPKKHSLNRVPKTAQKLHQTIDAGSPILRQKHNQTSQEIPNDKNPQDKPMAISVSSSMNKFRSKVQIKKNPVHQKINNQISAFVDPEDLKEQDTKQKQQIKEVKEVKDHKIKKQQKDKTPIEQQVLTESKTILSFGDLKVDQKGAILSDQILGKVKIRQINFFVDKKNLYGVHCKYFNHEKPQIFGMKICEKNADEKCEKISLVLNTQQEERISTIKFGYSLKNEIKMIEITTSLQKSLKWSVQNEVNRSETKSIQKYSSFCIKAKLISTQEIPSTSKSLNQLMNDRPKLKLAGLGFSVIELVKSSTK